MSFIADFHIHSKYSRATSRDMEIPNLDKAAQIKGIDLVGTGDFTHPFWRAHLKKFLSPVEEGIYRYKRTFFILTSEVSSIFYRNGKLRKIHIVIFAPDFEVAEKVSEKLGKFGDLYSDGRPTLKLDARDLVRIVLDVSDRCLIVPAHVWTPWFSLFGANSGFDSVEECFEDMTDYIYALETGLSSDPAMNWQISSLDRFTLISNSDAHSPHNLAREANVFSRKVNYSEIREILINKDRSLFLYTLEFFPQEGKYHWDGHRKCGVSLSPDEAIKNKNICPKCKDKLTIGVMHRVRDLADREENFIPPSAIPFKRVVPLREIIAEALNEGVDSKSVVETYMRVVNHYKGEINVLLNIPIQDLSGFIPQRVVEGIERVREGKVKIRCGYDGVYGKVSIFDEEKGDKQLSLF